MEYDVIYNSTAVTLGRINHFRHKKVLLPYNLI